MRPIDADALPVHKAYCVDEAGWGANFYVVDKSDIDNAPAIDAVPVVRCKDCEHWCRNAGIADSPNGHCFCHDIETNGQDFCSYGEKRDD
jgi:hypothetical protein